ncbi:hypothetical protein Hydth_0654 [Hydrogenobacter thermophilus TK-6]|uniref:Uncharacterized protein n=1 Tax=Hydrogenobacter thermophilus (strain DSM 6534 / IAM 12695 / TK-6) TaxID=608538 RepID=D3DH15_HYDTT|nr:hypothetical protein [Hydrogenobacter thermophilus]ADO45052.1 hypothetical protein Hydth_0654 [Hydrogenobacter thermophilus TK-6]BAI69117.1 hypothetical protein HTH_0656 [Hydrogenobacter thermophilus TK-6]
MRADKKLAAATLASLALFGAQKAVQAKAVMVPFIAVGNGWQTIVSYATDTQLSTNTLHIAYNIKPAVSYGQCLHADGFVPTSTNDLTSFFIDGTTNTPPTIYGDTIGGTYAPVAGANTYFGFMAVATEDAAGNVSAGAAELAVDTISFNAGLRFLYAQRSIDLNHLGAANAVNLSNTGLTTLQTTKFMTFAPADANPMVYAVGVSTADNVFGVPYNVPIALNKVNNNWWNRSEQTFSDGIGLFDYCVTLWPVCAPSSAPTAGFISNLNCQTGTIFAQAGGWFHLVNDATNVVTALATIPGVNTAPNVIVFKVESNPAYGYAVTPLHPMPYTTE